MLVSEMDAYSIRILWEGPHKVLYHTFWQTRTFLKTAKTLYFTKVFNHRHICVFLNYSFILKLLCLKTKKILNLYRFRSP